MTRLPYLLIFCFLISAPTFARSWWNESTHNVVDEWDLKKEKKGRPSQRLIKSATLNQFGSKANKKSLSDRIYLEILKSSR